jgi:cell division control protein 7
MATSRQRNESSRVPFDIHLDNNAMDESMDEDPEDMEDSRVEDDDDLDDEDGSQRSDDSNGPVDPTVQEDIKKFEESFAGIRDHFRLINRIGEGQSMSESVQ